MEIIGEKAARYYDLQNNPVSDIPFYKKQIPHPKARVLELGCGTGRVLIPLAASCGLIHGIDASEAMLSICREKLAAWPAPEKVRLTRAQVSDFDLAQTFDLIIAPFRVFQNLETQAEAHGFLQAIRRHLAPSGSAILTAFRPSRPPNEMRQSWRREEETIDGETMLEIGKRLVRSHRRPRLQSEPLVVYPELIYRLYGKTGELEDETILPIAMRCWYPEELEKLLINHGFRIIEKHGGYEGEAWGEGPELVITFGLK